VAKLPEIGDKLGNLIYRHYEKVAEDWRRPHLGASIIGSACNRHLWYGFRWAVARKFGGRLLRLFKRGDIEEDWVVDDLKAIGIELEAIDPESKEQWRFSWFGGHFGGSCDGVGKGFPDAPKSWHVFECKTSNTKWFKAMLKGGVQKANPKHYAQMQTYMHGFRERGWDVSRAYYVMVCKETDQIYSERVRYDKVEADAIMHRAELIVGSPEPLSRIQEDPTRIECKFCDHRGVCHFERVEELERNCRTCTSVTPLEDGTWFCEHWQRRLDVAEQRKGCSKHLFIPSLLPWDPVDADLAGRAVYYRDRNGVQFIDSAGKLLVHEEDEENE
jgi:hypothetical protein